MEEFSSISEQAMTTSEVMGGRDTSGFCISGVEQASITKKERFDRGCPSDVVCQHWSGQAWGELWALTCNFSGRRKVHAFLGGTPPATSTSFLFSLPLLLRSVAFTRPVNAFHSLGYFHTSFVSRYSSILHSGTLHCIAIFLRGNILGPWLRAVAPKL